MRFVTCLILLLQFGTSSASASELQSILSGTSPGGMRAALEGFVGKHPEDVEGRYQLALTYMSSKMDAQAEEQLRACMEIVPVGTEMQATCIQQLRQISEHKVSRLPGVPSSERSAEHPSVNTHVVTGSTQTYGGLRRSTSINSVAGPSSNPNLSGIAVRNAAAGTITGSARPAASAAASNITGTAAAAVKAQLRGEQKNPSLKATK